MLTLDDVHTGLVSLRAAYSKREQNGQVQVFYEAIRTTGASPADWFVTVQEWIDTEKWFPTPHELRDRLRCGAPKNKTFGGTPCSCGRPHCDGFVTVFRPELIRALQGRYGAQDADSWRHHMTCAVTCDRLSQGDLIEVPHGGANVPPDKRWEQAEHAARAAIGADVFTAWNEGCDE